MKHIAVVSVVAVISTTAGATQAQNLHPGGVLHYRQVMVP
jgi:hypothetical protein